MIDGIKVYFSAPRSNAPIMLLASNNSTRVTLANSQGITWVDYSPDSYNGMVTINSAIDMDLENNKFISTTFSPAQNIGIRISEGGYAPGLRIMRNKIKNFQTCVSTSAYAGDVLVENNEVIRCPIPYN